MFMLISNNLDKTFKLIMSISLASMSSSCVQDHNDTFGREESKATSVGYFGSGKVLYHSPLLLERSPGDPLNL